MKSNKKIVYICMAAILPVALYLNRDLFISADAERLDVSGSTGVAGHAGREQLNASISQPLTPEKAKIAQSVTDLAVKIIEHSPNQTESFFSAAEAQSLRLQKIRTQRKELAAKERKAEYENQLYTAKAESAHEEVQKTLNNDSADKDTSRYTPSQYTLSHQSKALDQEKQEKAADKKTSISDFSLRSVRHVGGNYKAVISDGVSDYSVNEGFELPGGVYVKAITAETVTLKVADKTQTLFVF